MLVLVAITTGAVTRPALAATSREDHLRAEIAQLLNGERALRGLGQLPIDAQLSQNAQAWAERNRGCDPSTDCHSPGVEAEILAWGYSDSKTGAIVVAWMQSSSHRDIVLHGKATSMGVGFACADNGVVAAVVQFAGVRKPVAATDENPIASAAQQGSACAGDAAPLTQTAPPSTTTTTPAAPPPTTATPTTQPVRRAAPAPQSPVTTTPVVAAPVTAPTTAPPTTAAPQPITTAVAPRIELSAAPVTDDGPVLQASQASSRRPRSESTFVLMVVVVVFLSVLRVGFQLRDAAEARSKDGLRGVGL